MKKTVFIDRGDHFEVITDYSGSTRHSKLTLAQWQAEYANHPSYANMRKSHPGSVAGETPRGVGRWKKDWTAYQVPCIKLVMSAPAKRDFDGVPAVLGDGGEIHQVKLSKVDQDGNACPGDEPLRVLLSAPVGVSNAEPRLKGGVAEIEVGPSPGPCDVRVTVADPAGRLKRTAVTLRFL